jgi:hypothetical protein
MHENKKPNCIMGQYYMYPYLQHAQNKWLFSSWGKDIMVDMVVLGYLDGEKKICNLQFVVCFWCLKQGHHLIDFEAMQLLFQFLKVKNIPRKHWNNNARLKFAQTMHHIMLITSKETITIHATSFLVSFYEVTIVDKQSWLTFMLFF